MSGISDDYAVLDAGRYRFYYGYEYTVCPRHGNDSDDCGRLDCDSKEWAFVVFENDKERFRANRRQVGYREHDEPVEILLKGVEMFAKKEWPKP